MPEAEPPATDRPPMLAYASPERTPTIHRWLAVVVLLGLLVRLAFSLSRPDNAAYLASLPDQVEYLMIGQSILDGEGVSFVDGAFNQTLYAYRMPGYPAFVAALGADPRAVRAGQALLDASTCLAVILIARRLQGDRAALVAAVLVAFNPYAVYFSSLILSETLFMAMLMWGVYLLLSPSRMQCIGGVALLLLSVYVRPSAIGLGGMAAVVALAFKSQRLDGWHRSRYAETCVFAASVLGTTVAVGLILLPWALRNQHALGQVVWTTTNSGFTAYDSFNPTADGSSNLAGIRGTPNTLTPLRDWHNFRRRGEVGRSDDLNRSAWQYATTHPARVVELAVLKLGRFWSPVPLSADFGGRWLYVLIGGLYAVPLFVFAAIGVWRGGLGRRATFILLLPALYFSCVHSVFVGSLRYRVPCDAPLAVLAAAGVMSFARAKPEAT